MLRNKKEKFYIEFWLQSKGIPKMSSEHLVIVAVGLCSFLISLVFDNVKRQINVSFYKACVNSQIDNYQANY